MSRRFFITAVILICISIGVLAYISSKYQPTVQTPIVAHVSPVPTRPPVKEVKSIFVPYWNYKDDGTLSTYDRLFYFGVTGTQYGVATNDQGYYNLQKFVNAYPDKDLYLTLKMLDTDTNLTIIKNPAMQQKIMDDTINLAKKYNFKGIVIDLEIGALPLSDVTTGVTSFLQEFYTLAKEQNLQVLQTAYGDNFYRHRPFDIKTLATDADEIVVMAYDFHKVNGLPGPNFPFSGAETYGYDFKSMVDNFLTIVPAQKLTVIFGMYGYDWLTDEQKRPITAATAISLDDIKKKFLGKCDKENCVIVRDNLSQEVEINYVDSNAGKFAVYHDVWYEDETSVSKKVEFLKDRGVGSIGYWVYGYF